MRDVFQKQICAARIVFTIPFAVFLFIATAPSASAGPILGPNLSAFAILGGAGVTFDGGAPASVITGSVGGCCNAVAITGAIPTDYTYSGGTLYLADGTVPTTAHTELGTAMAALEGMTAASLSSLDNNSITGLGPGVYSVSVTDFNTTLILDGGGNTNALWVFLLPSSLTTASSSNVIVQNTGADAGVYWVMEAGTATLGSNSTFVGNILAYASANLGTNVTDSCGRLLTQTASVTLAGNDTIGIGCSGVLAGSNGLSGGGTLNAENGVIPLAPSYVPEPSAFFCLAPCLAGLVIQRKLARSKLAKSRA
jgi:hypothetical protein